jgi:hypothetical protein
MEMEKNNLSKEYLEELIEKLVKAGEDKEELSLWVELYDVLTEEERAKIIANLEKELQDLQSLK